MPRVPESPPGVPITEAPPLGAEALINPPPRQRASTRVAAIQTSWRGKMSEWLARYGLAELAGLATAMAGAWLAWIVTGNEIATAYGGAIGENVGFYGVIISREVRSDRKRARTFGADYGRRGGMRTVRNLLMEFGPAEAADSLVLRPLAMGIAAHYLGLELGVLVGKIAADFTFYIPVIATYELRKWHERRSGS
jgi:hypothetical protein